MCIRDSLQQLGVAEGDGSQFLHREVVVTHHPLEAGHICLLYTSYKEGEAYKVTVFKRSGIRRKLKPETYLLQEEKVRMSVASL